MNILPFHHSKAEDSSIKSQTKEIIKKRDPEQVDQLLLAFGAKRSWNRSLKRLSQEVRDTVFHNLSIVLRRTEEGEHLGPYSLMVVDTLREAGWNIQEEVIFHLQDALAFLAEKQKKDSKNTEKIKARLLKKYGNPSLV